MNEPMPTTAALDLRDIHLPEPVSWWPVAPGWWLLIAVTLLLLVLIVIARKIYLGRQLKRDIAGELEAIKQRYQQSNDKSQLAKALSVLLRRASITYYPETDIAGLTGERWLAYLDETGRHAAKAAGFRSETGKVLLSAPYLPEDTRLDYDAQALLSLCESWLLAPHHKTLRMSAP
jgi:hypothetical protein